MTDAQEPARPRAALRSALERYDEARQQAARENSVSGVLNAAWTLAEAVRASLKEKSDERDSPERPVVLDRLRDGRPDGVVSEEYRGELPETQVTAMPHGLFNLIDHVAKCAALMREELIVERGRR